MRVWAGIARRSYNNTVALLKEPGSKANRFAIQKDLLNNLGETYGTPYKIKQMAIEDACLAVKAAKVKFLKTKKFQEVKFRSRKQKQDSLYIPSATVSEYGFYKSTLGNMKFSESIGEIHHDCRLVIEDKRFYLIVPQSTTIKTPDNQRAKVVSLDPGVRTFLTAYDTEHAYKIGNRDFDKVFRQLYSLDRLYALKSKTKGKKKSNYKRPISKALFRIKNLINELHKQTASFLVQRYDNIVIPHFAAQQMTKKLRSKTCRAMLGWAHSKFREFLKLKCEEYSVKLSIISEEYTSKTCGSCGYMQNIGSKEFWKCKDCGHEHDRDANGARNILLLALSDTTLI